MQNRYKLVDVVRSVGEFSVCVLWGVIIFLGILSAVTVRVSWVNRLLFFLGGHWGHFQLNLHEPQSVQTTRSQQFSSLVSLKFYYLTRRSVCYHHQGNVDKAFFFYWGPYWSSPFWACFWRTDTNMVWIPIKIWKHRIWSGVFPTYLSEFSHILIMISWYP